ncbi:DAO-domain-containing protein [Morchella conica CCBAS932]|uniref:DAO-domain-containing protein n=1 Tax=Morchella conica CCBAS932 TaxID=1392247 RepID=A0A3N4KIF2_9PEZI|nr:DAO-domain-containing protein [Morchella conica CCBAS932]
MGGVVSTIKLLIAFSWSLRSAIAPVVKRIQSDPGKPCENPTESFWLQEPHPVVSQHQSDELPSEVDVVIIGSGITGTAIAKTLLEPPNGKKTEKPLSVAMLDAREACSGATGRNGGHIKESAYSEYESLKNKHGKKMAMEIIRFRLAHLDALIAVAEAEGEEMLRHSQIRKCDTLDICFEEESWEGMKYQLRLFLRDFEDQRGLWLLHEKYETRKLYPFPSASGAISSPAGALWPYRFVTSILNRLLKSHPHFSLDTSTPVLSVTTSESHPSHYLVSTPRGNILAKHVVHATNAHAAHLLPGLRGLVFPVRGHMTAQRPTQGGCAFGEHKDRSFSFTYNEGFDYVTQVPPPDGEGDTMVLIGGALFQTGNFGFGEVGATDEDMNIFASAHLAGIVGTVTGKHGATMTEGAWTGVMGFTPDLMAWVGPVPVSMTGGRERPEGGKEWVSAGYCGEGMVNAWLSGVAVGRMINGEDGGDVGLPKVMLCTEERARKADLLDLVNEYLG